MKKIAVYCGASKGNNDIYVKEAYELGIGLWCWLCRHYGRNSGWCIRPWW